MNNKLGVEKKQNLRFTKITNSVLKCSICELTPTQAVFTLTNPNGFSVKMGSASLINDFVAKSKKYTVQHLVEKAVSMHRQGLPFVFSVQAQNRGMECRACYEESTGLYHLYIDMSSAKGQAASPAQRYKCVGTLRENEFRTLYDGRNFPNINKGVWVKNE